MERKKRLNKKFLFILVGVLFILFFIIYCFFIKKDDNKENNSIFNTSFKSIENINYDKNNIKCDKVKCNIGKIKLDNKKVNVSFSTMENVFNLYIDDKTAFTYELNKIISFKSINSKYIMIKKSEIIITDQGLEEEVINYEFVDNTGEILLFDELINIDLSEVE